MSHRPDLSRRRLAPLAPAAAVLVAVLAAADTPNPADGGAPARTADGPPATRGSPAAAGGIGAPEAAAARRSGRPARDTVGAGTPWFCGSPDSTAGAGAPGAGGTPGAAGAVAAEPGAPGADEAGAGGSTPDGGPSRDLYCQELLPTPRGGSAAGVVQLSPAASPFGAPLTRDGRFRYRISMRLRDLPAPSELGPYETYVAWAAAPTLRPMVLLGEVGDGLNRLAAVDLNKFLVLITAEATADLEEREGPVVLRAQSPSMRMQPHDLPFGFMRGVGDGGDAAGGEGELRGGAAAGALSWTPPPMPPGLPMVPPLGPLRPSAAPFLPSAGAPDGGAGGRDAAARPAREPGARDEGGASGRDVPDARPRRTRRLEDGDTLRLEAGLVQRTIRGRSYVMYGYNGQYPGPLIRVPQGAEITVIFENRIGRPSTVHWHGVRLENRFDGVPGVTQELVRPGDTFVYRVRFPDAGIYWYHPHHREDLQQDLGLYGNMLVEPAAGDGPLSAPPGAREPSTLRVRPAGSGFTYGGYFAPVNREEVLMLDDLLVGEADDGASRAAAGGVDGGPAGAGVPGGRGGHAPGPLVPYGEEAATHALMGRFGNLMLVNGRPRYRLRVTEGEVVRFYLTNVAGTRTFNLSFGDLPVKVVASDLGRYERPVRASSAVLSPAERYVVEVRFDEPGTVPLTNRVQALDHVYGNFFTRVDTLGKVEVAPGEPREDHGEAFAELEPNPGVTRDIARYRDAFDRPVDERLELSVEADSLPWPVGSLVRKDSIYFHPVEAAGTMPRMNWVTTTDQVRWILRDPATGAENMEIDWRFRVGEVVKIRLRNRRQALHAMQHPIHLHGQRFLVLSRNGRRSDNLVWKDTALVPAGTTATLLLELTNPGEWMLHCHVAEHLGSGMKMTFEVVGEETGG